jgi:hypothetical protein
MMYRCGRKYYLLKIDRESIEENERGFGAENPRAIEEEERHWGLLKISS